MSSTVEVVYRRLAPIYDVVYGVLLQPGRRRALERLAPQPGERILEVGVGTGFGLADYPAGTRVVAMDLSAPMLERASARLRRHGIQHVTLCRIDACRLAFANGRFDAVYAPYLINVVPDPVRVVQEMLRVCRPGGRLVLLNHFDRAPDTRGPLNRLIGFAASRISGVNWFLDLPDFLVQTGLTPHSIDAVNIPKVSSVVVCRKPPAIVSPQTREAKLLLGY